MFGHYAVVEEGVAWGINPDLIGETHGLGARPRIELG